MNKNPGLNDPLTHSMIDPDHKDPLLVFRGCIFINGYIILLYHETHPF